MDHKLAGDILRQRAELVTALREARVYADGRPYRPARGRRAVLPALEDHLEPPVPAIDLTRQPSAEEVITAVVREMRIRFYQPKSIKSYRTALQNLFAWHGGQPHEIAREDVRAFLEHLVNERAGASWVSIHISAIRTAFDKMAGASLTSGLATPRRARHLPTILSKEEVVRLLEAAQSLRDKLLIAMMYATGMRVSEVVRLRFSDLDFDRNALMIREAKGRKDRQVMLPLSLAPLLHHLAKDRPPSAFMFVGSRPERYIAPRVVQLIVARTVALAGIGKRVTPHSLRHAFATHLLEAGTDIRFIQKLLGHLKLETTRMYAHVAQTHAERIESPIDAIMLAQRRTPTLPPATSSRSSVGLMRIEMRLVGRDQARAALVIPTAQPLVRLDGIAIEETRPGWYSIDLPPLETWAPGMTRLSVAQRERLQEPEFYERLRELLVERYLRLRSPLQAHARTPAALPPHRGR
jgi:integrase/recombinase XerD